jgi:hypothetical protein
VDERNLEAEHALPRSLVDQLGAGVREVCEGGADVVDLVGDVVHSGAALGEEATDRSVLSEGAEQLEPALPDPDRGGLHALLVDARAMLEPGAEEALVSLERTVEVVDGEPHVMNRAGGVHPAIVFERLAPTMRVPALAFGLAVVVLAGCGSSKKESKSNGEASKSPTQVLADAKAAATNAATAHVSGSIDSGGTPIKLDLSTARGKGAKGSMSTSGRSFDLVRIGDTVYIQGSDDFYKHFAGAAVAQLLHGKWLKASATQGPLKSLGPLTNIGELFTGISAHHGKLASEGVTTYRGQKVVEVRDTSDNSKLYVAATGKPYPVAISGGKKGQSGTITFGDWNSRVSLSAPENALDISQLGLGG